MGHKSGSSHGSAVGASGEGEDQDVRSGDCEGEPEARASLGRVEGTAHTHSQTKGQRAEKKPLRDVPVCVSESGGRPRRRPHATRRCCSDERQIKDRTREETEGERRRRHTGKRGAGKTRSNRTSDNLWPVRFLCEVSLFLWSSPHFRLICATLVDTRDADSGLFLGLFIWTTCLLSFSL